MREAFCLLGESKRRRYYCSTAGRILSVSKADRSRARFLREIPGRRHWVRIDGRNVSVPVAMALSFFRNTLDAYSPVSIRYTFRDGNPDNLDIDNICFFFEDVHPGKEGQPWSR